MAAAVHGIEISPESVDLAKVALKRRGLTGEGIERDRRPTSAELNRLFRCFDDNARLTMPMTLIVQFAIVTALRLDEICRVDWSDLDVGRRTLLIRDRKYPKKNPAMTKGSHCLRQLGSMPGPWQWSKQRT